MKHYGKISDKTNKIVDKAGFQIIKDQYGDYEVAARDYDDSLKESKENLPDVPGTVANALKKEMSSLVDAQSFRELKDRMLEIIDNSKEISEKSKENLKAKLKVANNLSALGTWMSGIKTK